MSRHIKELSYKVYSANTSYKTTVTFTVISHSGSVDVWYMYKCQQAIVMVMNCLRLSVLTIVTYWWMCIQGIALKIHYCIHAGDY